MSRRERSIVAAIGLLIVGAILSQTDPPLFWQGSVYGFLFIFGGPLPNDNGPYSGPAWVSWTFMYGFQAIVLLALLIIVVVWVICAPARQRKENG